MSAAFPIADYAEDQRFARTILTTHVMHRGFQTGAGTGTIVGAAVAGVSRLRASRIPAGTGGIHTGTRFDSTLRQKWTQVSLDRARAASAPVRALSGAVNMSTRSNSGIPALVKPAASTIIPTTVRSAGVGGAIGGLAMAVMLPGYMSAKEHIEWQDRSWRLLNNQGQVAVDNWSLAGVLVGITSPMFITQFRSSDMLSWRMLIGRAGVGSLAGVTGYMVAGQLGL
ncbi:hypothetical protein H2198_000307 [Neophaeococcomyces mojaviensis]|uniref:Uncharacterized protein n=1 Tax=Neophaeococcomyces mojaviensis TaxID=3383035 RepID=A0ACC3AKS3_9EURO|nr:hypothetical protein H2198_000307 [Knufia sp. JES_112]